MNQKIDPKNGGTPEKRKLAEQACKGKVNYCGLIDGNKEVYEEDFGMDPGAIIGYPFYIVVDEHDQVFVPSSTEEIFAVMDQLPEVNDNVLPPIQWMINSDATDEALINLGYTKEEIIAARKEEEEIRTRF